jgi:tetratricopeptide (TPR) repeat protein
MRLFKCLTLFGALALAAIPAAAQRPDNLTRLELARKANPQSVAALRSLGIAYYRAGRYADARPVLEQANRLAPRDGMIALYLGMSAEQTGEYTIAKDAYSGYVLNGRTSRVRKQLKTRLAALQRRELELSAKSAVAREASLSSEPGSPMTIAVLPLKFTGSDSSLMPLERGLADLMVTDLSRSPQLTILERDRVQALLDEISLSKGGRVDAATSVRTGKIMRAGRVIAGGVSQLGGRSIRIDAAVVDVPTTLAGDPVQAEDQLDALFNMEKKVVLGIYEKLGIRLTPAEQALVQQRPTRSLAAFLSYSAGLLAQDKGNLDEASRRFEDAARLDPSFTAAADKKTEVDNAKVGASVTVGSIETMVQSTVEGSTAINAADHGVPTVEAPPITTTLNNTANDLNPGIAVQLGATTTTTATAPSQKDPASTASGDDKPAAATGKIVIVVRQP